MNAHESLARLQKATKLADFLDELHDGRRACIKWVPTASDDELRMLGAAAGVNTPSRATMLVVQVILATRDDRAASLSRG
jgi:hypothetical protein